MIVGAMEKENIGILQLLALEKRSTHFIFQKLCWQIFNGKILEISEKLSMIVSWIYLQGNRTPI